jgi:ABC-2 type transport system ATP-binding protein
MLTQIPPAHCPRPADPTPARPTGGPVLTAAGLVKRYGNKRALDGFALTIRAGEIAGLVGHNGAGKTTFVEIVTGLVKPDAGTVTVVDTDALCDSRRARQLTGVAPQETALYPTVTVRDNLRLFGSLAGLRRSGLRAAIDQVAEELQLTPMLGERVGLLSGGQRRRTQAAAALIGAPPLLLLDEPTAGADPQTRAALLAAVRGRAAAGAAVLYTTHYLPELADLGATLAVARAGRIIARGTQDELMAGLPSELRIRLADGCGAPALPPALARHARITDDELRLASTNPAADLAALLAAGCEPAAVDVHRPGLDDLYSSLTPSLTSSITPEATHEA